MINWDNIRAMTCRMARNNSHPRLRKRDWTDENIFHAMKKLNKFFEGKRIVSVGGCFFNFQIALHEGHKMGGTVYYYQTISFDRVVSWEKDYQEVIDNTTEMW